MSISFLEILLSGEGLFHEQDMLVERLLMEGVLPPDADLMNLKQVINAHRKCLNIMAGMI